MTIEENKIIELPWVARFKELKSKYEGKTAGEMAKDIFGDDFEFESEPEADIIEFKNLNNNGKT